MCRSPKDVLKEHAIEWKLEAHTAEEKSLGRDGSQVGNERAEAENERASECHLEVEDEQFTEDK